MIAPFLGVGILPSKWWLQPWVVAALVRFWPKQERARVHRWLAGIEDATRREEVMARIQKYLQ